MQSIGDFQGFAQVANQKMTASYQKAPLAQQADVSTAMTKADTPAEFAEDGAKVNAQIRLALERANKKIGPMERRIERSVHEGTKAVIYKVRDTKNNQVISEFPSEQVQTIIAKLWEVNGLMVDYRL